MYKNITRIMAAAAILLLGMSSCTTDILTSNNNSDKRGEPRQVIFSINTGAQRSTRATSTAGASVTAKERENTVSKLYAVVFEPAASNLLVAGTFSKTYEVTLSGAGTDNQTYSSATFTMDDAGLYYMYLVANPGTELEKNLTNATGASSPLVSGTSDVGDFFALVESDQNPNSNGATNFLMTSNMVQVDIQADAATDLTNSGARYIDMTRAAARIDIDATALGDDFVLTSVTFNNRHPKTVLVNQGTDDATTGESSASTSAPTYTKPAVDGSDVTANKWLGGIYGYENHAEADATSQAGITQLVINGTYKGIAVSQTVDFWNRVEDTTNPGTYNYTTIPLNRNTLYYVTLKLKETPEEYAPFAATINVADWVEGETLVFAGEDLAKACKPELISIKRQLWDDTNNEWKEATDLTLSTVSLDVVDNGSARTVTGKKGSIGRLDSACRLAIRVKAGATGCNITCPQMDETMADAAATYHTGVTGTDKKGLFEGEQSNPDKEYDADGNMYLTWYVQISDKCQREAFNFTLTNQLNSQEDYITHFQLISMDPRLNPLWWVGEYNVNQNWSSFNKTLSSSQGYLFNQTSLLNSKFSWSNSAYDGWKIPSGSGKSEADRTIEGVVWHAPTRQEWYSIAPNTIETEGNILIESRFASANTANPSTTDIRNELTCVFGYNQATQNGFVPKSYWGTYTNRTRYAIRFIGTEYCSAWRYELISNSSISRCVISSRLIDVIDDTDAASLAAELIKMSGGDPDYWSDSNLTSDKGGERRSFYACGYNASGGSESAAPGTSTGGTRGLYWSTSTLGSYGYMFDFYIDSQSINADSQNGAAYPFSVRLFRDK